MDTIDPSIEKRLNTKVFGRSVHYYDEIESTNTKALELAREGAAEGTVVWTGFQSSGKGGRATKLYCRQTGEYAI